jgi:tRNA 2-thiouridine synthesizing protein A
LSRFSLSREKTLQSALAQAVAQRLPATILFARDMNSTMHFDKDLDARGLNCPLPILRAKKALTDMGSGQVLRILATDPGAVKDFQAFSRQTGNPLLAHTEQEREFEFFMRKK